MSLYEDTPTMEEYVDKYVNKMGEDAEGPYIELGILPNILRCGCIIHNLDLRSHQTGAGQSQNQIDCP